jgi:threonine dehydratase
MRSCYSPPSSGRPALLPRRQEIMRWRSRFTAGILGFRWWWSCRSLPRLARGFGAKVILHGQNIGEAKEKADELVAAEGFAYVHGFDGAEVISGQGTLGLEILEQVPDVEAIVCPIGGAGLIAGLGLAVKSKRPEVQIIGVEPTHAASFQVALNAGRPVKTNLEPTLGDGLAVPMVGARAFEIARKVVDKVVTVDEGRIALSILQLLEMEKGVVEGAGAVPLAALDGGRLPELKGKKVVLVLCGGNIDPGVLGRVIELGLVQGGRLAQFQAEISDRPGGLALLTEVIAETGASVQHITHERAFGSPDISKVEVTVTVETRDAGHFAKLRTKLRQAGIPVSND